MVGATRVIGKRVTGIRVIPGGEVFEGVGVSVAVGIGVSVGGVVDVLVGISVVVAVGVDVTVEVEVGCVHSTPSSKTIKGGHNARRTF